MPTRRHAVVALALAACAAWFPAESEAGVLQAIGRDASFKDRRFETNHVIVRRARGGGLLVADRRAAIMLAGGCRRLGARAAVCPRARRIEGLLGEGDDVAEDAVGAASIWGEGGNDTILERPGRGEAAGAAYRTGVVE